MSVLKNEKTKDYTVMSNYHLKDRNLSYKAKGLLSFMLSLPEDWNYSINSLVKVSKESTKAIRSTLKELESMGYLIRNKLQLENGKFTYEYSIHEKPFNNKENVNNCHTSNGIQININNQINKGDKQKISSFFIKEKHNILTLELIDRGYIRENDSQIFCYDNLFKKLLKENCYQDLIAIIHYIVSRVKSRDFTDEYENPIENKFGYFKNAILNNINRINIDIDDIW